MKKEVASEDMHERARKLIDIERVEGLAPEDRRWLHGHLAACQACARWAASAEAALRALRSVSVALPPGLAAATNLRMRKRAAELKQQRAQNLALIVGCAFSWILGVASAPLVWKVWAWIGGIFGLPRIVWELGFVAWWFVPAAVGGLVILWERSRSAEENLGDPPGWE